MSLRSISECQHAFANVTGTGVTPIVGAVTGRQSRVYRLILVNGGTANVITLQDTNNAALSQAFNLVAGGSVVLDTPINGDPWWVTGVGLGLQWNSTAQPYGFDVWYLQS